MVFLSYLKTFVFTLIILQLFYTEETQLENTQLQRIYIFKVSSDKA